MRTHALACIALAAGIGAGPAALAQQPTDTLVTISHNGYSQGGAQVPAGDFLQCRGTPTCVAEYQTSVAVPGCSGSSSVSVRTTVTGVNLAATSLQGTIVIGVVTPLSCTQLGSLDYNYTY